MPLFHIHGIVAAVLASLSAGATVVCTPGFDVARFFDWIDEFAPSWYTAVPAMHQAIVERSGLHPQQVKRTALRFVRSSSASLPVQLMERLEDVFRAPVVEAYGMTEAAHQVTSNPLPPRARKPGSVGLPAGPDVAVMDPDGQLLGPGARGEIVIRGANVTAGYAANPEANRSAFCDGWFRTGDEGCFDADGYLFLTGRLKEMINRGGEKIAPRAIDEALMTHPAVAEALAFGVPDAKLGEEVAAAVVLKPGASAPASELQDYLALRLAEFKIPRRIIFLQEIPKGPTGKTHRAALAARLGIESVHSVTAAVPGLAPSPMTGALIGIWKEVLRREDISGPSHFFDCGGDSILATQAAARVNALTGRSISAMHVFRTPTPAALASWLDANPVPPPATQEAAPTPAPGALSPAQARMLFLHSYEAQPGLYNRPALLRLRGDLDVAALRGALDAVVERHEALRTGFAATSDRWIARVAPAANCPLEVLDLRADPAALDTARTLSRRFLERPFELSAPPLLRVLLLRLSEREFWLAVSMHHAVSDGWSSRIFFRDLASGYASRLHRATAALEPLAASHADVVAWQESAIHGARGRELEAYWRRRLAGAPSLLELPTDFPRPARETFAGAVESLTLEARLTSSLRVLARSMQATLFTALLAGFQSLLARVSGATDFVVGTPVAGRSRPEFEPLVGLFVNTLPLRCDLSGNPTFREIVRRAGEASLEAIAHQDLPFERLVELLKLPRSLSYPPLVQVMFQLRNVPVDRSGLAGCDVEYLEFDPRLVPMELSLEIEETPSGLRCRLFYRTDLFRPESARTLLAAYRSLLESAAAQPDLGVGGLNVEDTRRAGESAAWSRGPDLPIADPLPYAILRAVETDPGKPAFVCSGRTLTFREYHTLALRTAGALRTAHAAPGQRVAIFSHRRVELPAWILGVWLAGCVVVPVDPDAPPARIAFMLSDASVSTVISDDPDDCTAAHAGLAVISAEAICRTDALPATPILGRDSPACVIYTSGSSGYPKGVELRHGPLRNVLDWVARSVSLGSTDTFVGVASFTFDMSFGELYLAPSLGATVHLADDVEVRDGQLLAALLASSGATFLNATPTTWSMLLESGWPGSPYLRAASGGEAVTPRLAALLGARVHGFWNFYGPTETTDISVGTRLGPGTDPVPIGLPAANTTLHVLDRWGQPVLAGFPGELYIGGVGVAGGYINRPELTASRFVMLNTPAGPVRTYRTGDLVRSLPEGGLEFLGRVDHQIKLRGHRIELGEIEALIRATPGVALAAAVLLVQPSPRIGAFYSCASPVALAPEDVRSALRAELPAHMVPALIRRLESFPMTVSGKIDRKALEALGGDLPETAPSLPLSPLESEIHRLFAEVLERTDFGPDDNFFDLGGHSLSAVRLVTRLNARFTPVLPLRDFFGAPCVRAVAAVAATRERQPIG